MGPEEIEKKIQEERTLEATKKGLMGLGGKLGRILRVLGHEIEAQYEGGHMGLPSSSDVASAGWGFESIPLDDPDEEPWDGVLRPGSSEEIQDQIPYADGEVSALLDEPTGGGFRDERNNKRSQVNIVNVGWHFDGLPHGVHMEIFYKMNEEKLRRELSVYFRGYLVYLEATGSLLAYIPNDLWEKEIERLFELAKKRSKGKMNEIRDDNKQEGEREKKGWLKALRDRWGI